MVKEDCPCFTDLDSLNSGVLHPIFGVMYLKFCISPLDRNPLLLGSAWCHPRSKCGCAVEIQTQVVQASHTEISKLVHILFEELHLSYTDKTAADPEKQFIPGLCSILLQTPQSNRKGNSVTRLPWLCLLTS